MFFNVLHSYTHRTFYFIKTTKPFMEDDSFSAPNGHESLATNVTVWRSLLPQKLNPGTAWAKQFIPSRSNRPAQWPTVGGCGCRCEWVECGWMWLIGEKPLGVLSKPSPGYILICLLLLRQKWNTQYFELWWAQLLQNTTGLPTPQAKLILNYFFCSETLTKSRPCLSDHLMLFIKLFPLWAIMDWTKLEASGFNNGELSLLDRWREYGRENWDEWIEKLGLNVHL